MKLYFFNTPARVGGAGTKFHHLLRLLHRDFEIILTGEVPPGAEWNDELDRMKIRRVAWRDLPDKLEGWAVSLCNHAYVGDGLVVDARRRGLRTVWSNEMMWLFPGERAALMLGAIDCLLYVSPEQRAILEPLYCEAAGCPKPAADLREDTSRCGHLPAPAGTRWVMTGNWIDPDLFPWPAAARARDTADRIVIGRMSRPDPDKFPDDFPHAVQRMNLRGMKARVMGWSEALAARWPDFHFSDAWDLLPPDAEPATEFLASLDLFVYDVSPRFSESWGRAVVEAMLCGAVPLVPGDARHHLHRLVPHGSGGFHCHSEADWIEYAQRLQCDTALRRRMAEEARARAVEKLCRREEHLALWASVFHG